MKLFLALLHFLNSLTLKALVVQFGRTDLEAKCDNFFGYQMILNARESRKQRCSPPRTMPDHLASDPSTIASSSLHCHTFHQSPGEDLFCEGENIQFDFDALTSPNPEWYTYNQALRGVCDKEHSFFENPRAFRFANGDYYNNFVGNSEIPLRCSQVIDDPVLVVTRDGEKNLAFALTDFVNAFAVLETVGLLQHPNLRILIMDQAPEGPFIDLWRRLFSPKHEIMWANQLMSRNGGPGNICFNRLVFALPGPLGFLNVNVREPHLCSNSEILESFSRYVAQSLELPLDPFTQSLDPMDLAIRFSGMIQAPVKVPTVTLISRRPITNSQGEEIRSIGRQFKNEDQLIEHLKQFEKAKQIKLQIVDLAKISIREQIEIIRGTNALIGAHGAGMAHVLFLPKESVILEIFPRRVDSMRYRNWAKFAPTSVYLGWTNSKPENCFPRSDIRPNMGYWDADMHIESGDWELLTNELLRVISGFLDGHGK